MAKLIGTDPNQVPTNADLGTMAYQDSTNTVLENAYINAKGADGLEMGRDYTSPNNSSRLFFNSNVSGGNWTIFNNSGSLKMQSGAEAGSTSGNYTSVALSTTGAVLGGNVTMPNQPAFHVVREAGHVYGNGTRVKIVFDTTVHNQGGHYDTSTGEFTAPIAGRYVFIANGMSKYNQSGDKQLTIHVNGTGYNISNPASTGTDGSRPFMAMLLINLAQNDIVHASFYSNSTNDYFYASGGYWNGFMGYLLG